MRKPIALIAVLASVTTWPALAQQNQGQTTNASNSAGAAINQNFESGHKDKSIATTPGVYPPGLDAGTNNCAISYSGGGSVTGFGLSLGAAVESEDCNERNWIALFSARGWDDVAMSYACLHNAKAAMAFESAGYDCPEGATRVQRRKMEQRTDKNAESARTQSVPEYCSDGGWADSETIRANCPPEQAERILRDRGW